MAPSAATRPRAATPLRGAEIDAWRAYIETVHDLNTALENDISSTGLSVGDYQVLVFLSESPDGAMRMVDLAARLQLSPSGLTRRLDGLVKHGHVERVPSQTDRRVMLAVITPAGRDALDAAYPVHLASVRRRFIDRLEPADVEALARIFRAVAAGVRGDDEADDAGGS